jgi:LPXTG-motif cell wall-anchored protein
VVASGAPSLAATGADTTSGLLRFAGVVLSLGGALMALAQRRPAVTTA